MPSRIITTTLVRLSVTFNLGLSFFWTTLDLMSFTFVSEDSVVATRVSSDVEPLSAVRLLIILDFRLFRNVWSSIAIRSTVNKILMWRRGSSPGTLASFALICPVELIIRVSRTFSKLCFVLIL